MSSLSNFFRRVEHVNSARGKSRCSHSPFPNCKLINDEGALPRVLVVLHCTTPRLFWLAGEFGHFYDPLDLRSLIGRDPIF